MSTPNTKIFLIDNGSLRPQATFVLRVLAEKLSVALGQTVEPVSLLHSHKIPAEQLGGVPATIVRRRLNACVADGVRRIIMLPLFLGPSLALADYLPELIEEARKTAPELEVKIAQPLAGADVNRPDQRLAEILADHTRTIIANGDLATPTVVLVDHGTPIRPVNTVRNAVAQQLGAMLETEVDRVIACSMERRAGDEYAFNDPLLENLDSVELGSRDCVAAMFFLLPGRHAGEGGDVAEICDGVVEHGTFDSIKVTPLLAEHPKLLEILADRFQAACSGVSLFE